MMGRIEREVVNGIFRSSSSIFAFEKFLSALPQKFIKEALPSIIGGMAGPTAAQAAARVAAEQPEPEMTLPVRRTGPKLGRNDPCPLDPKKKFKNCCGALGEKTCIKNTM
jgi:preprotein translocase subunit SecA